VTKVVIIGAGLSGLTCGLYLQEAGLNVSILEKNSQPGGLTRSWPISNQGDKKGRDFVLKYLNEEDIALQYPMHMIFEKKYPNLLDVYDHLGILDNLTPPIKKFHIIDSRLKKHQLKMEDTWLPAPFHAIKTIWGLDMGIVDRLSFLSAGLPILYLGQGLNRKKIKDSFYDSISMEAFLKLFATKNVRDFVASFVPSIYNLDSIEVNARRMSGVVTGTFFMSKQSMWYRLVNDNYTPGTIEPHVKQFEKAGGKILLNSEVKKILHNKQNIVTKIVFENGDTTEEISAKYFVAATRGHQLLPLLDSRCNFRTHPYFKNLARETGACSSFLRVFYDKKITDEDFITGVNRRVFCFNGCQDISNIMTKRYKNYPGSVVDVLADRAEELQIAPIEKFIENAIEDLKIVWPKARKAQAMLAIGAHAKPTDLYHKEIPRLSGERNRFTKTPFENMFAANCSLGLIGIGMESAYQAGKLAANEILKKESKPRIKVHGYPNYKISFLPKIMYWLTNIFVTIWKLLGKIITAI